MGNAIVFKTAATTTAVGLTKLKRDELLSGLGAGAVPFLFDFGFPWCWPAGVNPVNGNTVKDISETADGSWNVAGASPVFAGNGIDFTGLLARADVRGPVGCLTDINTTERFMVVLYAKLPASVDWASASIKTMFQSAASAYTTGADLLTISQSHPTTDFISARRQTNGGSTVSELQVAMGANYYGQVCQIGYWRNAAGTGLRVKSALGAVISTSAIGSDNTGDFSATQPKWGNPPAFAAANNHRLYRGWVENLSISGRDPLTVLDADWTRVAARAVFS
ncbi:hypothetical protein NKJ72_11790 [Mesorhizobium sp. M0045]|uniref:hypothetical protein n=1 Tax=Mesorhizobium sp. M0045 TaxID=2956857 RepID=UPI0033355E05